MNSLALERPEHLVALCTRDDYLVFSRLLDHPRVDELGDQVVGHLAGLDLVLEHLQLLLHLVELSQLLLSFKGLLLFCFLLGLDLLHGASSLAADLQHIGRDALGYCDEEGVSK